MRTTFLSGTRARAMPLFNYFHPTMPPLQARRPWLRLLLTLLTVAVTISFFTCLDCLNNPRHLLVNFGFTSIYTVGLWLTNGYAVDWLDKYVGWKQAPGRRLVYTLLVSLGGSLAVIVLVQTLILLYEQRSLSELWSVRRAGAYFFPLATTAMISLFLHSRSFLMGWREALVRNERLQKEMAQAEAESLRQQLDPHFMFNALNALTSLVEEEPKLAVRFIRQLSQVYRYVLDARQREVVPLADELEFAQSYLFLQNIRYGEALHVELPTAREVPSNFVVPPLSLQLLLENALKHNAASATQPLHLRIALDEAGKSLTVRNTLRPRRLAPGESLGIGLPNLTARYAHLTAEPVRVERTEAEFVVTLPVLVMC
ncbi:sensor histidine kinase [Hymenobacter chitinivorans]|uniref:Histidine kinase n=1 Tax=Hymenobacter chitinivorans DSM 11115 TaxID=1121954 RepID=A0A2M9BTF4_9BACT|nr:histidine kinase [Hymenobacter chitinivorans]PJJ61224.1 histidine kinase [Hymenobacter chitinivorans DSM 11115]